MATLISDETDFKAGSITRHIERHFIMMNLSIQQEDTTILNSSGRFWVPDLQKLIEKKQANILKIKKINNKIINSH